MRFTEIIAIPFPRFPTLNFWYLLIGPGLGMFDPAVGFVGRVFGKSGRERVRCDFDPAQSVPLAFDKDPNAYLFGVSTGGKGVFLADPRAEEWRLSYYLPEEGRRLDIRVAKNRAKAEQASVYTGGAPAKISADHVNMGSVLQKVNDLALHDLKLIGRKYLTALLFFPAVEFGAEAPPPGSRQLPETRSWSVVVLGAAMEPLGYY